MRAKDDYDGAEPSGNSVALMNLLRLHRMTGRADYEVSARRLIQVFEPKLASTPHGMPQMLAACEFDLAPVREVVVAGTTESTTGGGMLRLLRAFFDPNRVLLYAEPAMAQLHPQMEAMSAAGGGSAVYICENFACQAPVMDEDSLFRLLK
jgi:uncharacterized protein YyaL (SSP411 family)